MRKILLFGLLAGAFAAAVLSGACSTGDATSSASNASSAEKWVLSAQPPEVIAAYVFAGTHRHEAERIPCYCGCVGLGHGSLLDCFIKPSGGYEEHAAGCGVCRDEAMDLKRFVDSGEGVQAARAYINSNYGKLGKPTDTP